MAGKVKAQIIEINKTELKPGAKYIFLLDPMHIEWLHNLDLELNRLIGDENYTLIPVEKSSLSVYEIDNKLN